MTDLRQLTIDEIRRARPTDPDTSRDAARQAGQLAADHRFRILAALRRRPECPMAPFEIAAVCSLEPVQVCRRLRELADDGEIVVAGVGTTPSGRSARTWRIP
jgi:thiamine pyrophosphate-dependent acetolactate synthase large subunit-like protein